MFKIVHNTDEWPGTVSARGFYGEILICYKNIYRISDCYCKNCQCSSSHE